MHAVLPAGAKNKKKKNCYSQPERQNIARDGNDDGTIEMMFMQNGQIKTNYLLKNPKSEIKTNWLKSLKVMWAHHTNTS